MPDYMIPQQLVQLLREHRVIPFIGAGFSNVFGLPNWQALLEDLGNKLDDGLTFEEVSKFSRDDYLQIAEYYFIKTGRHIGPLRHTISQKLRTVGIDPLQSGHHVDLINLGTPSIYTTNYDDLVQDLHWKPLKRNNVSRLFYAANERGRLPTRAKPRQQPRSSQKRLGHPA